MNALASIDLQLRSLMMSLMVGLRKRFAKKRARLEQNKDMEKTLRQRHHASNWFRSMSSAQRILLEDGGRRAHQKRMAQYFLQRVRRCAQRLDDDPPGSGGKRDEVGRVARTHLLQCNRHYHHRYLRSHAISMVAKQATILMSFIHDKQTLTAGAWTALPGTYISETNLITRAPLTSNIDNDGVSDRGNRRQLSSRPFGRRA